MSARASIQTEKLVTSVIRIRRTTHLGQQRYEIEQTLAEAKSLYYALKDLLSAEGEI